LPSESWYSRRTVTVTVSPGAYWSLSVETLRRVGYLTVIVIVSEAVPLETSTALKLQELHGSFVVSTVQGTVHVYVKAP